MGPDQRTMARNSPGGFIAYIRPEKTGGDSMSARLNMVLFAWGMCLLIFVPIAETKSPNILLAISDDHSWPHASAYGSGMVDTPAFDRVAKEGLLFNNAFAPAPQCSPGRAALLTGRNIWQIGEAGSHSSYFPRDFPVYTDLLETEGYLVGYTGKPWYPGNWWDSGWSRNPAGDEYNEASLEPPHREMSPIDYTENFHKFLANRKPGQPFCFWYGAKEPHREYEPDIGISAGKSLASSEVPGYLPDTPAVRADLLDYAVEIEWFDQHLGEMIRILEEAGELENTIIVVTGDNGMAFPRAKANLYEHGVHVPLAIRWGKIQEPGRRLNTLTSFIDFAPTFLEAAGIDVPDTITGQSLLPVFHAEDTDWRQYVLVGRERHSHSRINNWSYPARAIRTQQWLYIRNLKPDRWPAGNPNGLHDIDGSPSKDLLIEEKESDMIRPYYQLAVSKRPSEELFDILKDPDCLNNLALDPRYDTIREDLRNQLLSRLKEQGDPRLNGRGDIFESYPRMNIMREKYEGFKGFGIYNPEYIQPDQTLQNEGKTPTRRTIHRSY